MTALATAIIDDRNPQIKYSPSIGWNQQHIPSECRGVDEGEQFLTRVTDFARDGTWTTALAETGTANITMEFRGTAVYGFFMLFTRVLTESNAGLPPENVARLSFFLNDTEVNPAPLRYEHWWYTDFPQDSIVPNLLMLSQENLPADTHVLTIQYSIDATQGQPQVVFAFDRVQYVPIAGFTTKLPPATFTTPSGPSLSSQPTSISSSTASSANGGREGSQPTLNTGMIVGVAVGVFVFLLLVGSLIVGLCWYRRKARRAESNFRMSGNISPDPIPPVHETRPAHVTPFVSSGGDAQRGRAPISSSFGNMGALPATPMYEKSSRPSASTGARAIVYPEPYSAQLSNEGGSPQEAVAPPISGKGSANRRRLVVATSDEEGRTTSSGSPTSGLSYVPRTTGDRARPPSYTSERL